MNAVARIVAVLLRALVSSVEADETFRTLKVKDEVYTNVTVTSSSATDIYFTHSRGLASAKLKDLDPDLQKHFHYDVAKSAGIENAQRQATFEYRQALAKAKPVPVKLEEARGGGAAGGGGGAPRI